MGAGAAGSGLSSVRSEAVAPAPSSPSSHPESHCQKSRESGEPWTCRRDGPCAEHRARLGAGTQGLLGWERGEATEPRLARSPPVVPSATLFGGKSPSCTAEGASAAQAPRCSLQSPARSQVPGPLTGGLTEAVNARVRFGAAPQPHNLRLAGARALWTWGLPLFCFLLSYWPLGDRGCLR